MNPGKSFSLFAGILFLIAGCASGRDHNQPADSAFLCPDHGVAMREVRVVYGKPDGALLDKAQRGEVVLGGCEVFKDSPHRAYICPVDKRVFYSCTPEGRN